MTTLPVIQDGWEQYTRSQFDEPDSERRSVVYASRLRSCTRAMALDLLFPAESADFDIGGMERMLKGREREESLITRLHHVGPRSDPPFQVIEQQRKFVVKDRDGTPLVAGRSDATISFGHRKNKIVLEAKSGQAILRVKRFEDFSNSPWTRHMPDQLLCYLYGGNQESGVFALDHPAGPHWVPVELEDHLGLVEENLGRCREAVDAANEFDEDGLLPDHIDDPDECRRCSHFGRSCCPPIDYGAGLEVIDSAEINDLLVRRFEALEAGKQFLSADREIKKMLRDRVAPGTPIDAIAGQFELKGKWYKKTTRQPPTEDAVLLAKYLEGRKVKWPRQVSDAVTRILLGVKSGFATTDPVGSFRLKIDRIPGELKEPSDSLQEQLRASLADAAASQMLGGDFERAKQAKRARTGKVDR